MIVNNNIKENIIDFLENRIPSCKILVVGDVMLDGYLYGEVERISPEAPVPINHIMNRKETLGGAANVAHNLARLGCQTQIIGVVGNDRYAGKLYNLMKQLKINSDGIIAGRQKTTTKIRVLSGHQQMVRLDFEESAPLESDIQENVIEQVRKKFNEGLSAIILSDYNKGICTSKICQSVITMAHKEQIPILVDPKGSNWSKYQGADYITPNVKEIGEAIGHKLKNEDSILQKAADLVRDLYDIDHVFLTRSEKGVSLYSDKDAIHIPTIAQEVYDVSGAGDTVISVFSAAISCKLSVETSAYIANFAAGIGVSKVGTYAVSNEDIRLNLK